MLKDAGHEDEGFRGPRERHVRLRQDVGQFRDHDHEERRQDERRVDHGALDLGVEVVVLLHLVREVFEDVRELARRLAGPHHVDVELAEDRLVPLERVREPRAALHLVRDVREHGPHARGLRLAREVADGVHDGHGRGHHDREVARHDHDVLALDAVEERERGLPHVDLAGRARLKQQDLVAAFGQRRDRRVAVLRVHGPGLDGSVRRADAVLECRHVTPGSPGPSRWSPPAANGP